MMATNRRMCPWVQVMARLGKVAEEGRALEGMGMMVSGAANCQVVSKFAGRGQVEGATAAMGHPVSLWQLAP